MNPIPRAETGVWRDATLVASTRRVFPLVTLRFVLRGGATGDPAGKEGLSALTARMLERGTTRRSRERIAADLESLGATLALNAGQDTMQMASTALSRNLERVVEILAEVFLEPTFPPAELEKLRAEMLSELSIQREEDRDLGDAWFRRALYGANPYGHFVEGTEAGLAAITRDDVVERWRQMVTSANLLVAAAGDVDLAALADLCARHLGRIPQGHRAPVPSPAAREVAGIDAVLVDKPERSQTQIFLGRTAVGPMVPEFLPLMVATHAFGGMFTSRLMQEVRVKRGWSYGASARLEMNRGEGLWGLWTFPANGDTIACVRLLLDLVRDFTSAGVTSSELDAAKGHLRNMLAFEVETPEQLIQRRISEVALGLPEDWTERWLAGVEATTEASAKAAARAVVGGDGLVLAIVCTADPFRKELEGMEGVRRVRVVPFDAPDPDAAWGNE